MGVRYVAQLKGTQTGISWEVHFHDSLYVSAANAINMADFELNYNGSGDERDSAIKASEFKAHIYIETSAHETFLNEISNAQEERFSAVVYKNTAIYWAGHILTDLIDIEDISYPFVATVTATDGLARLKDIPYDNNGNIYSGRETVLKHIQKILLKLNTVNFFDTSFIRTSVNWYDINHVNFGETYDPLLLTDVDNAVFVEVKIKNSQEIRTPMNCYDVLTELLRRFFCRISLHNGCFNVIQVSYYNETLMFERYYDGALNDAGILEETPTVPIDKVFRYKGVGGNFNFFPPLRSVELTYAHNTEIQQNLIPTTTYYPAYTVGFLTGGFGNNYALVFNGILNMVYKGDANNSVLIRGVYEMEIKIGSYYAYGENKFSEWRTTPSVVRIISWKIGGLGNDIENMPVNFITSELPVSGICTFSFRFIEIRDVAGINATTLPFGHSFTSTFLDFELKYLSNNNIEESKKYSILNTKDGTNPVDSRINYVLDDMMLGDGVHPNSQGRLQVYDGSVWVDSSNWAFGALGGFGNISDLMISEFLAGQKTATRKMDAEIIGNIDFYTRIEYDNGLWLCNGVGFTAGTDTWSGEWFEIKKVTTNNILQAAVNIISQTPIAVGFSTRISGTVPYITTVAIEEELKNYHHIEQRSLTATSKRIAKGITNSIDINTITLPTLKTGDEIILVNIANGEKHVLTVDANQGENATSISIVSYEFNNSLPIGSYVYFSGQRIAKMIKGQMSIDGDKLGIRLLNDVANPGERMYYGTNEFGVKGWYNI